MARFILVPEWRFHGWLSMEYPHPDPSVNKTEDSRERQRQIERQIERRERRRKTRNPKEG